MNLNNVHIGERNAWHGSEVMALRRNIKLLLNLHINTYIDFGRGNILSTSHIHMPSNGSEREIRVSFDVHIKYVKDWYK